MRFMREKKYAGLGSPESEVKICPTTAQKNEGNEKT